MGATFSDERLSWASETDLAQLPTKHITVSLCSLNDSSFEVANLIAPLILAAGAYASEIPDDSDEDLRPICFSQRLTFQIKLAIKRDCPIHEAKDICFMGVKEAAELQRWLVIKE